MGDVDMSLDDLKFLIQVISGLFLALVGGVSTWIWRIATARAAGDKALHEKIDEVKRDYVRRDDLDAHMVRQDRRLDEIQHDQRQMLMQITKIVGRIGFKAED